MTDQKRTVLVTGGSRGIGRAVAERLAEDGFDIILTYVSKPELAEAVCAGIKDAGGSARALCLDVSDAGAVAAFFADEIKDKVRLWGLVNNAGVTKDGLIVRMKDEDFARVLNVNLAGAFTMIREAGKILTRLREGRIVNIASVVGQMGNAGQANYAAAKAGLIGLTKTAAREFAPRGVTVNAVAPGFIKTDMTANLPEKVVSAYMESIPLKKFGSPGDVADAVSYLASDRAGYVTGQVLAVNGGLYM